MKAKRVKSLIALLLVLAMMLPTMPFSYADPPAQPKMLNKELIGEPDPEGNYSIKLTVEDTGQPQKHDVVIVFDVSYSMLQKGKLANAKAAAIKYAETLLAGNLKNYNRISVVSFADGVHVKQNFTNNIDTIRTTINGLTTFNLTNIHAGLHQARLYLANSNADQKLVLLLSDGEPTASYGLKRDANLYYYESDFEKVDPNLVWQLNYGKEYQSKEGLSEDRMDYSRIVFYGEGTYSSEGYLQLPDLSEKSTHIDYAKQAYNEAGYLKDAQVSISVIAYDLGPAAQDILKKIASPNSFYSSDVNEILAVLSNIADNFAKYKNVVVTDPIGELFDLVADPTVKSFNGQAPTSVSVDPSRRVITWTIGELKGKATMEYKVKLKAGYENAQNNSDYLVTNGPTGFGYDGGSLPFPVPQVPINKVVYKSEIPTLYTKAYNYLIKQEREVKGINDISMPLMPPGKVFVGWKEASTGDKLYQKGYKLELGKSYEFTAVWKNNPELFADAYAETQGEGGRVFEGPALVEYDKTKLSDIKTTFNATPDLDYLVDKWFIKKGGNLTAINDGYVFKKTDCEVLGRIDLVVTFKKDPTKWVTITAESNNTSYGTVTGAPLDVKKPTTWGDILKKNHFTATPKDKGTHKFVGWQIKNTPGFLNNDSPITESVTVVAVFELLKDVRIDVTIEGQGTVGPTATTNLTTVTVKEGTHWRDVEKNFKVQKPGTGYKFDGFYVVIAGKRVKLDSSTNDYKFNENTNIFAVFVKDDTQKEQITVVVIPEKGKKSLTGSPAQVYVADTWGDIIDNPPFTLTLNPGYEIAKWTLDEAGSEVIPNNHKFVKTTTGTKVYAHLREKAGEWFDVTAKAGPNGKLKDGTPTKVRVHKDTPWSEIKNIFKPVADEGYKPGTWTYVTGGGTVGDGDTFNTNKTVQINFVPDDAQKVQLTAVGLPKEMLDRIESNPQSVYKFETWAQIKDRFKVVAKTGYEPYKWTFDQQGNNEIPVSHKFTSATTVYVHLREKAGEWFDVTAQAGPNGKLKDGTPTKVRVHKDTPWSEIKNQFKPEGDEGYKPDTWTYVPGTNQVGDGDKFNTSKTVQINFVPDDAQNVDVTLVALPTDKAQIGNSPQSVRKFETWSQIKGRFTVTEVKGYEAYKYTYDAEGNNVIGENDTFKAKTTIYVHLREKAGEWFTINAIANPNGSLDTNSPAVVTVRVHNTTPWSAIKDKFRPIADEGYKPGAWTHDKEGNNPINDTDTFGANKPVYINFVPDDNQKVAVTLVGLPADKLVAITNNPQSVYKFELWKDIQPKFTVEAKLGYEPKKWTLDMEGKQPIDPNKTFKTPTTVYVHLGERDGEWFDVKAVAKENGELQENTPTKVRVHKTTAWSTFKDEFKPQANAGYTVGKWTYDGTKPVNDTDTFAKSETVYIDFVANPTEWFDIDAKARENGSIVAGKGGPVSVAPNTEWQAIINKFEAKANPGYRFDKWVLENGDAVTLKTKFTVKTTVYATFVKDDAQWFNVSAEAKEHGTVTGGPVSVAPETAWSTIKDKFTHKADDGFKFAGWTLANGTPVTGETKFTEATTVYANFTKDDEQYTFINAKVYKDIGGSVSPTQVEVLKIDKYSAAIAKLKTTKQDGYVFQHWVDENGNKIDADKQVKENDTIYAKFLKDTGEFITVRAVSGPNGSVTGDPIEVVKGTTWTTITTPQSPFTTTAEPGYKFINWTLPNGNVVALDTTFIVDTVITANFAKNDDEYIQINAKIYNNEGGTLNSEREEFLKTDTYAKLPSKFTVTPLHGYAFTGWVDSNGTELNPTKTMTDEETVYARLERLSSYWIRINAKVIGEGEVTPENAQILKDATWADVLADKVFKADPKPGHKLVRWAINETGTEEIPNTQTFVDGSIVYAVFEKQDDAFMNIQAEAFPPQGGTVEPLLKEVLKGTKWSDIRKEYKAVPAPGYSFDGWYIRDTDQKLPKVGDDETVVPNYTFDAAEVVIQARFKEDSDKWIYVMARSKGNGQAIGGAAKVLKDSTWDQIDKYFTVKPDSGYRFSGWTNNKNQPLVDNYVFSETQEIYANFDRIPPPKPKDEYQEYNPGGDGGGGNNGGGNNGGSGPDDTIIDEDDVAKGILNYNDFYAYIQGYPDGSVRSGRYVNREETAAIFFRLLEPTYKETIRSVKSNFKDISPANWSNKHISTLANGGIIKGYSDGTFRPTAAITRAELAVIAAKFDRVNNNPGHNFTDVKGHWAEKYIANASAKGWIKGYPNGQFKPDTPITRAEFVTFVNKVLGRNVKKTEIPAGVRRFTDLKPDAWYYENMVTATNSYLASTGDDGFQKWSKLVNLFIEM